MISKPDFCPECGELTDEMGSSDWTSHLRQHYQQNRQAAKQRELVHFALDVTRVSLETGTPVADVAQTLGAAMKVIIEKRLLS